jgi:hypothetical protein
MHSAKSLPLDCNLTAQSKNAHLQRECYARGSIHPEFVDREDAVRCIHAGSVCTLFVNAGFRGIHDQSELSEITA